MLIPMSQTPDMRAGDEDRDQTVTLIREAFAAGRLTNDEFQQRMTKAHESKTFGELAALVSDLPDDAPPTAPAPAPAPGPATVPQAERRTIRNAWAAWLSTAIVVNVIWLLTWVTGSGGPSYYWPMWVMGPWAAVMLVGMITGRIRQDDN